MRYSKCKKEGAKNMIFSEKLQLIRESKGLTQEELAEMLCVSRQAAAKWESGQAYPDQRSVNGALDWFQ